MKKKKDEIIVLEDKGEAIVKLEYGIAKIDDNFYHEPTEAELEGNYRITGPYVALMPGKWNQWDFKTHAEVVGRDAHTFLEQPDGDKAYITNGHTKNPLDRLGWVHSSENQDNKVVQRMMITDPEAIKKYDSKLLGKRVSIEADTRVDLRNSTPTNRIVLGYQGRDVAIVKRPACVTCPSIALEDDLTSMINKYKAGEPMSDKDKNGEGVNDEDVLPESLKTKSGLTSFVKGLFKTFSEGETPPVDDKPPVASLEDDDPQGGDEKMELEQKVEAQATEIAALQEQNKKYEKYFTKLQQKNKLDARAKLEQDITDAITKIPKMELEENHFMVEVAELSEDGNTETKLVPRSDADLQGELKTLNTMLSLFPDGPLPNVVMDHQNQTDYTALEKEVAELEDELGSSDTTLEI